MIEKEEWKFWKDTTWHYRGAYYEISNFGRLRKNGVITECRKDKFGRVEVTSTQRMHRIVYELFVGPIPKGYEIDHIDTNMSNNRLDNLRLCTHNENMKNPLTVSNWRAGIEKRNNNKEWKKNLKGKNKDKHRVYNEDGTWKML